MRADAMGKESRKRVIIASGYALLLWVVGFVWGMVVFMVPAFKEISSVPYLSKLPAVSLALIPVYAVLLVYLTRRYLRQGEKSANEALKFGFILIFVTAILDTLVYVLTFRSYDYFGYVSIWVAYGLFLGIPWLTGRQDVSKH